MTRDCQAPEDKKAAQKYASTIISTSIIYFLGQINQNDQVREESEGLWYNHVTFCQMNAMLHFAKLMPCYILPNAKWMGSTVGAYWFSLKLWKIVHMEIHSTK